MAIPRLLICISTILLTFTSGITVSIRGVTKDGRSQFMRKEIIIDDSAQQPTCPNGQAPKLEEDGTLIQCLPGASQKVVCGKEHVCFFTGMNYVCCPSNEPTEETQLTCNAPYLTVLGTAGRPLKCSPRTRMCPGKTQFCSDVGLDYICCERTVGREPPAEVEPVPKSEDDLECPKNTIGVLTERGLPVVCNSRRRCPGRQQFCYGGMKRSICCERYEMARNNFDDEPVKKLLAMDAPPQPRLKQVKLNGKEVVPTEFLESTVIRSDSFVSNTMRRPTSFAIATAVKHHRRQGPREVESLASTRRKSKSKEITEETASVAPYHLSHMEKVNSVVKNRHRNFESAEPATRRTLKKKTTTQAPTTKAPQLTDEWLPTVDGGLENINTDSAEEPELLGQNIVRTTEAYEVTTTERVFGEIEPFRRARVHSAKTLVDQDKPISLSATIENDGFAPSKPLEINDKPVMKEEDKKKMAENYLMHQIKEGWPYADKFYRPDAE
ncbi:unnamed protein product, partial [Mesorhabditis spiculigera]